MPRFLGIDPGLNKTGYAVVDSLNSEFKIVKSGVIKTEPSDPLANRLQKIYINLFNIINQFKPDFAGIEDTYVNNNFSSSLKLAHARSAAILAVCNSNIEISELSAKTVKKTITGSGAADKIQVEKMLQMMLGTSIKFSTNDESDALAIALSLALTTNLNINII